VDNLLPTGSTRFAAALCAALAASAATPAGAQPRPPPAPTAASRPPPAPAAHAEVEGSVLALQGEELVLDLGAARGAENGATVELWRPLKLKHPVTGKVIAERFRIGALELVQVRAAMSLARVSGALTRPAEVGDIVLLPARGGEPAAPTPGAPPAPAKPGEPVAEAIPDDPDARAVTEMFDRLRGADLATRIAAYDEHVRAHRESRFVRVLGEEAAALRELIQTRSKTAVAQAAIELRGTPRVTDAVAGAPLRLAVELNDAAAGAVLHVRRGGAPLYTSLPMTALGNGYFAAVIPGDLVAGTALEYFVEGVLPSGKTVALLGGAAAPQEVEVFQPPRPAQPARLPTKAEIAAEYADYNRLRRNDYVFQTEGTFGVRYGDTGVRALRLGFGVYRGVGGSVDDLDKRHLAGRAVGLTYGYLETEIGFVRAFSVIGRVAVGLIDEGVSGGGQVLVRIGSDLKTNLVLGGELLGGVGLRGITQLELATFERFPILLRTEVTNQPAGVTATSTDGKTSGSAGSIGGRGIVQVGFKITPDLVVAVRGSFQGRTIQHAGPGFGGAVGYTW
jgi:hypothetical protein